MLKLAIITLTALYVQACGAPAKSASDVQASLDSIDVSLETKLQLACSDLMNADEPSLQGADLKTGDCKIDQSKVANYETHGTMKFYEPDTETVYDSGGKDQMAIYRRGQIWLSHDLVELAAKGHCVLSKVDELKDAINGVNGECDGENSTKSSGGSGGGSDAGSGGGGIGGIGSILGGGGLSSLVNIEIEPIGEPDMNLEAGVITGEVDVKISGAAEVDAGLRYSAGSVGRNIAVVLKTVRAGTKSSLLKNLSLAVIVIPHAGDVYVDAMFGAQLANIGVQGIINGILDDMLGGIVTGMMEKVILLDVVDPSANLVSSDISYSLLPEKKQYKKITLRDYINRHIKK